jgi:hypothetical protein
MIISMQGWGRKKFDNKRYKDALSLKSLLAVKDEIILK